ncbi:MAG: peptidoglycan-associated lipoprotein Pal [Gammaproteobacteria bacterium]
MKAMFRTLAGIGLLALLSACTTTDSVVSDSQLQDGQNQAGGAYDTRGVSDTYGYNPDGTANSQNPYGQITGGPSASQASRVVYFDFDSFQVKAESRPIIEAHANYLISNPGAVVYLEGHADERGTREYNVGLGDRRNNTVRQLMIGMGVGPQQIRTISYGEERPAVLGQDEASYALNRRVEIAY